MEEWKTEPNRLEWEAHGFKCLIIRHNTMGHLCGYVALPSWHPYYGKGYDDIDLDVHGGLTFAQEGRKEARNGIDWEEGYWWLGFDCAHSGDRQPGMEENFGENPISGSTYRNIEYVKKETERLASQLTILGIAERAFDAD